jgi:hypothetical protein
MKAFPWTGVGTDGMDLRDYFAAKAMQGLIAREDYQGTPDGYAEIAYKQADAMMEARKTTMGD